MERLPARTWTNPTSNLTPPKWGLAWHRAEPMPTKPKLPGFEKIETSTSHESELTTLKSSEKGWSTRIRGLGWPGTGISTMTTLMGLEWSVLASQAVGPPTEPAGIRPNHLPHRNAMPLLPLHHFSLLVAAVFCTSALGVTRNSGGQGGAQCYHKHRFSALQPLEEQLHIESDSVAEKKARRLSKSQQFLTGEMLV